MKNKLIEEKVEGGRILGKSYKQDMEMLKALKDGKKYFIYNSIDSKTHVIPDEKYKQILTEIDKKAYERGRKSVLGCEFCRGCDRCEE